MTDPEQEIVSRRGPLAAIIFYIVCILLFPAMVIGYVFWVGKLYAKRTSGVSGTAQGPLSARWFQHRLGVRYDEPAHRLLMVLPGISPFAVWLLFGPLQLAHRLSGYVPPAFRYPFEGDVTFSNQVSARQTFYDGVVEQYLADIPQFVILGAGFDTRAYRLPKQWSVRSFEVDTPETLAIKQEAMEVAEIDSAGVTFVAADFEKEDWFNRLVEAGFDADKPSLFLWEGVTPYLDRAAVEDTLRKIAGCARGSVIAFDYFTTEVLESQSLHLRVVRASLQAGGEPLKFGIDSTPPTSDHLAELLQSCGLTLREQHILGKETAGKRALGGYAIAVV
ncbi:class I SAM-dependent methyltransferase [Billgrantia endophytica]|uniref:S-adenosyl-L-methionine-dependent methyltransferase n=1 Tax=Billgrantia endophytica TaxID=2033802 RepID=A0A2N7U5W5_9GAMM|nr:SAM-dependent methyltransferase [Halomonas endophytica]PMR75825.1 hypothetical protein C1H69_08590 [Halomonas endophytica]